MTLVLSLICGLIIIALDQITKILILNNFTMYENIPFIKGLINLYYCENDGAAWSILSGKTNFLIILTFIVLIVCLVFLILHRNDSKLFVWSLMLIISGGIGNLIDRIFRNGKVVDFLQFDFYKSFPVFNIADIAIVIGVGLLILYFLIDIINDFKFKNQEKLVNDENK